MKKTPIILVAVIGLVAGAGLLGKVAFQNKPQRLVYGTGNPTTQAQLERLLTKHGVPFTHTSGERSSSKSSYKSGSTTINLNLSLSPPAVVIEDGSAPNVVAAMREFRDWLSLQSAPRTNAESKEKI